MVDGRLGAPGTLGAPGKLGAPGRLGAPLGGVTQALIPEPLDAFTDPPPPDAVTPGMLDGGVGDEKHWVPEGNDVGGVGRPELGSDGTPGVVLAPLGTAVPAVTAMAANPAAPPRIRTLRGIRNIVLPYRSRTSDVDDSVRRDNGRRARYLRADCG